MRKELEPCRNAISEAKVWEEVWGEAAGTEATGKEWDRGDIVPVHSAATENHIQEGYPAKTSRVLSAAPP